MQPQSHNECVQESVQCDGLVGGGKHAASSISVPQIPRAAVHEPPQGPISFLVGRGAPGMIGFGKQQEHSEERSVT